MYLILATILTSAATLFFSKDYLTQKANEVRQMYNYLYLVNHEDHFKTIYHIAQSIYEFVRIYLTQYVFHNSKRVGKNIYEIEYTINCKSYRFLVKYKQGPSKYKSFMKDESTDVSERVMPFLGPNDNFHGISYTPQDLGFESLIVHYMDGNVRTFQKTEPLLQ